MYDFYLFDVRSQTNKVIKQSLNNGGLLVTRALARRDRARQNKRIVPRLTRAAESGEGACGFRLIKVLSGRRETHSRYFWNTERQCRTGAKCALVSADFVGWLATLHLRHFSAVSSRSYRGE
jgi:hypothetical protein